MIRRRLLNHLEEADLRPEEGQALEERLERGELSAKDRERLAKVIRATQAAQQLLQDSASPPRDRLRRHTKHKRQLAKAARRRNRPSCSVCVDPGP